MIATMSQDNTLTQDTEERTQLGVRIREDLWIECRKLILDLRISPQQFVEEALEERKHKAQIELKKRGTKTAA